MRPTISFRSRPARCLLTVAGTAAALHIATPVLLRRAFRIDRSRHDASSLPGEPTWIPGPRGKRLAARYLMPPSRDPAGVVLVMHGWASSSSDMIEAVAPLNDAGLAVLLVDARCHGDSDDDDLSSMPRFAEDIASALDWLRGSGADPDRVVLLGHSVGAGAALLAATERQVAGVVAVASMAHPVRTMQRSMGRAGVPRPVIAYALWRMQRIIGRRFEDFAPVTSIGRTACPVLLIHGDADSTIPLSDAHLLRQAGGGRARLLVVEGADHRSSKAFLEHSDEITGFIAGCLTGVGVPPA